MTGRSIFKPIAFCGWLIAVGAGTLWLNVYGSTGTVSKELRTYPATTHLQPNPTGGTLIAFLHPQCGCSKVSLENLAAITAETKQQALIVFLMHDDSWRDANNVAYALEIPTFTVYFDQGGQECRRFGAETSGQCFYFDHQGKQRFAGGVTVARGHAGANPASDSLLALLKDDSNSTEHHFPVFGCSLATPQHTIDTSGSINFSAKATSAQDTSVSENRS